MRRGPDAPDAGPASWLRRVGWLVALWVAGVTVIAAVAALLRVVMHAVGLSR